jgi:hypothetical protein
MMDDKQLTMREDDTLGMRTTSWYRSDGSLYSRLYLSSGNRYWFDVLGYNHREDGPAIEGGHGTKEWWYHGKYMGCKTQQEFERLIRLKAFW